MYKLPKNRLLRVYLAGKISGDNDYKEKFNATYKKFKSDNPKLIIFSPASLSALDVVGFSWLSYMQICLTILAKCDFVYFHKDYSESYGSQIEYLAAKKLNKIIFIQDVIEPDDYSSETLNKYLQDAYNVTLNKYYEV